MDQVTTHSFIYTHIILSLAEEDWCMPIFNYIFRVNTVFLYKI